MPVRAQGIFYNTLTALILEHENCFVSGTGRSAGSCAYPVLAWLFRNLTRKKEGKREELGMVFGRVIDQR